MAKTKAAQPKRKLRSGHEPEAVVSFKMLSVANDGGEQSNRYFTRVEAEGTFFRCRISGLFKSLKLVQVIEILEVDWQAPKRKPGRKGKK